MRHRSQREQQRHPPGNLRYPFEAEGKVTKYEFWEFLWPVMEGEGDEKTKIEYRVWNPFRSKIAAAILEPFVDPLNVWMIRHHELFQGYYYYSLRTLRSYYYDY